MTVESRKIEGETEFFITNPMNGDLIGPFTTSGEAWRAFDRLTGEPVSRSEKTSEWMWQNRVHGE